MNYFLVKNRFRIGVIWLTGLLFFSNGCGPIGNARGQDSPATTYATVRDIPVPAGFERKQVTPFGEYLRSQPLRTDRNTVYLFNGQPKANQSAQFAVLKLDVGQADLQQCADAVMRLRAEYLFARKQPDSIAFHFVSGDLARWWAYAEGSRAVVKGNKVSWVKKAGRDYSYANFRRYLNLVFSYAGTASLIKELKPKPASALRPGDGFIQTRQPYGHAVMVMDVVVDAGGRKLFLLAQSYMPAQDMHILVNPENSDLSPWYEVQPTGNLETPEWTFDWKDLRRF